MTIAYIILDLVCIAEDLFCSILSFAVVLGITMPFVGALVRYRANYTPKTGAVHLEDEAGDEGIGAHHSDASIGYFGMMGRVYRFEGWVGLYKGIVPSIIACCIGLFAVVPITVVAALEWHVIPYGRVYLPPQYPGMMGWILGLGLSTLPALLLVPMRIIINRAITTPHKLSAFGARTSLPILLSPAERAQPLRLYLAPGVAFAVVLEALLAPSLSFLSFATYPIPDFQRVLALPFLLLTAMLVTPLQVIAARLTLQRRSAGADILDAEVDAVTPPPLYSPEPVVAFRHTVVDGGVVPYTSLFDCARKIVAEEGWGVFTRGWWLTFIALLLSVLTPKTILTPILN
ncbi:hypothetical protein MVEN_02227700 [Mycena venus]|uniref:Mitochondrial carrier n=1 Tax=Mycena venus TaxID=2733690 RepID=A0A8H6X7U1_9AGAR|nr:hypothetical protein MVEN_02227700 [Mycena venus]